MRRRLCTNDLIRRRHWAAAVILEPTQIFVYLFRRNDPLYKVYVPFYHRGSKVKETSRLQHGDFSIANP